MRRLQARLANLEKIIVVVPNAAGNAALQRALVRLTCEELRQLINAAELQEHGHDDELTAEHHAAIRHQEELVAEERALVARQN